MNADYEWLSTSVEQTHAMASAVARCLERGDVIALSGELGAGKTQFVQGLARGLAIDPQAVSSPTFVLVQEYESRHIDKPVLVHIDAYRMTGPEDMASIGWEEDGCEFRDDAIVAIEWADRVVQWLPDDRLDVHICHADQGRVISMTGFGGWSDRMAYLRSSIEDVEHHDTFSEQQNRPHVGRCPTCTRPVSQTGEYFPFCSDRCRQIDLGKWLDEKYIISRKVEESDLDEA